MDFLHVHAGKSFQGVPDCLEGNVNEKRRVSPSHRETKDRIRRFETVPKGVSALDTMPCFVIGAEHGPQGHATEARTGGDAHLRRGSSG